MLFQFFTKFVVGIVVIILVFGLVINNFIGIDAIIELDDIIVIIVEVKVVINEVAGKISRLYL